MKRSEINTIIAAGVSFLHEMKFPLPPFASWTAADWRAQGPEVSEIVTAQLGWDVTDFGRGDFGTTGLLIFTLRNGAIAGAPPPAGRTYAEKILVVRENQVTPVHFHLRKTEDIINRGGGSLALRLWNSESDGSFARTAVVVSLDGRRVELPAGGGVTLRPGESICLPPRLYHTFWGEAGKGTVLVGEVSSVNDDRVDNVFRDAVGRFPVIDEDAAPRHLLTLDYPQHYLHYAPPPSNPPR
jgi:D-lyxose ketol-isomerase